LPEGESRKENKIKVEVKVKIETKVELEVKVTWGQAELILTPCVRQSF